MKQSRKSILLFLALAAVLLLAACRKPPQAAAPPPPPPPPPPARPTATINANPDSIPAGQSTTLAWQTQNATDVSIEGLGSVQANGTRQVTPTQSTTYRLVAKGAGGSEEATTRVTVTQPPPPPAPKPTVSEQELFSQNIRDIYFEYDKFDIRPDQTSTVQANATWLNQHPNVSFTIEGHCDERGSTEYNLALGDNRANAVKNALVAAGIDASRIRTISYGKEKPFCTESNEQCWQQNRRGHFLYGR
ncbi:MAG: peptidoglycan-associated lipoprotein Pal [Candidatus Korobacteraceae bacterium]